MSMIGVHAEALDSLNPTYHEFLNRFKKKAKKIYGFVEGKDDLSFYKGIIEQVLANEWEIEMWSVGNKEQVILLYHSFEWNRFNKNQILFFLDKDLSIFFDEISVSDENIYITDFYSIENSIINRSTCSRVLVELYDLSHISKKDLDFLLDFFDNEFESFKKKMCIIMVWIIYWKRLGMKPCLNDIELKKIFQFKNGKIDYKDDLEEEALIKKIHEQTNIRFSNNKSEVQNIANEFERMNGKDNYIRGKYLVWFFITFCSFVHENIEKYIKNIDKKPQKMTTVGFRNAIALIGPRARAPETLKVFLNENIQKLLSL